jgi:hypothetical protein
MAVFVDDCRNNGKGHRLNQPIYALDEGRSHPGVEQNCEFRFNPATDSDLKPAGDSDLMPATIPK